MIYHNEMFYKVVKDFTAIGDIEQINDVSLFEKYDITKNSTIVNLEKRVIEDHMIGQQLQKLILMLK